MTIEQGAEVAADQGASQSEEDAAFLAEMKAEETGDVPAAPVEIQPEPEVAEVKPAEAEPAPAEPVREEVVPGYTKDELSAALAMLPKLQKALDSTNGTYGKRLDEQQRTIEELRTQRAAAVNKMTPDSLKRLSKEFPELASLLAEDLSEVMSTSAGSVDNSQIEQVNSKVSDLEKRLAEKEQAEQARERERAKKALTKAHPDWNKVALYTVNNGIAYWNNPQFGEWVGKQPAEVQSRLLNEVDADYLSEQLTAFKDSIKPRAVSKQKVIEDAVFPQGGGRQKAAAPEDEEEAAFRAEMAKR